MYKKNLIRPTYDKYVYLYKRTHYENNIFNVTAVLSEAFHKLLSEK